MQVDSRQQELIDRHLSLVIEANKVTNLTRITSIDSARILHIEDSLCGLEEINKAPEGLYADLGTGGGFPGIPIAIMTGRETLLVDSVKKKTAILDSIIGELGLSDQISTYAGRIEDLSAERKGQFSVVSARALSQLVSLMELASPMLKIGGNLVCYKANVSEKELETAIHFEKKLGMKLISKRDFELSDQETHRSILVFEKIAKPKIVLPRKVGFAQKKPFNIN